MSVLQFCCLPACGLYNPWVLGVSADGYKCDEIVSPDRTALYIGTDFGLTTYASFTDDGDPCKYSGIAPYQRDLSDNHPTWVNYSGTCDQFPAAINYCCCATGSECTPSQSGDQCEWFANDYNIPGVYFTAFNLLCLKTGVDVASRTVEETEYMDCCTTFFTETNCGEVACGCDLLYGNTTCNRSKMAYSFGDICDEVSGSCPDNAGYKYISGEPVLTTYYSFDDAVTANVLDANDPVGVYKKALIFTSLTGDTFTARMLLHDHIVDDTYDIQTYPGILTGYALSQGGVPDDDVSTPWGDFPDGPYSPNNATGYQPWVTITLTMTSGTYNGLTYTYHGYGTAQQFQIWAKSNWDPVINDVVSVTGSPNYWLGLRISPLALDTTTGQYTPFHEYRRIMTRVTTQGGIAGWMPDNSDDWILFSAEDTEVVWSARLRQFYTWSTYTEMIDIRAHGMSLDLITSNGGCCNFEHCTRTRSWYGVTATDAGIAPCTVTNPLIDGSGACGSGGVETHTHTDFCFASKCAASQQALTYEGHVTGTTRSTCFPSQYNVPMSYDFVQDVNDFSSYYSACIILP